MGFLLREKAEILTLLVLLGERDGELFCEGEDILLLHGSQRKENAGELFLREAVEVVTLIFGLIDCFEEKILPSALLKRNPRIVICGSLLASELLRKSLCANCV